MSESNLHLALYLFEKLFSSGPLLVKTVDELLKNKNFVANRELGSHTTIDFINSYPSLFETDDIYVYPLYSTSCHSEPIVTNRSCKNENLRRRSLGENNILLESEIVDYLFRNLRNINEKWVCIRDLSNHLTQSTEKIKYMTDNTSLLTAFLCRNSHIFDVQGKLVGLKGEKSNVSSQSLSDDGQKLKVTDKFVSNGINKGRILKPTYKGKCINQSSDKFSMALSSKDYETILIIKELIKTIQSSDQKCDIINLKLNIFNKYGTKLSDIIGFTSIELEEYIRKNSLFFIIGDDGNIAIKDNSYMNIVLTDGVESSKMGEDKTNLINTKGMIYHVARLWGIIDLGQHEHVFFDKSIFKNIEDLQKYFQIGEQVYFDAILAPKDSRAKWRATRVWKESDCHFLKKTLSETDCASLQHLKLKIRNNSSTDDADDERDVGCADDDDLDALEDEDEIMIKKFLLIPSLGDNNDEDTDEENTMKSIMSIELEDSCIGTSNTYNSVGSTRTTASQSQSLTSDRSIEVETQTLATGEIIAINFYQE